MKCKSGPSATLVEAVPLRREVVGGGGLQQRRAVVGPADLEARLAVPVVHKPGNIRKTSNNNKNILSSFCTFSPLRKHRGKISSKYACVLIYGFLDPNHRIIKKSILPGVNFLKYNYIPTYSSIDRY